MKKKIVLTCFMLLICSFMIIGIKQLQKYSVTNSYGSKTEVANNGAETISVVKSSSDTKEAENTEEAANQNTANVQTNTAVTESATTADTKQQDTKPASNNQKTSVNEQNTSNQAAAVSTQTAATTKTPEEYNLIITDTISGKAIKKKVEFDGQKLLYDIIINTLSEAKSNGEITGFLIESSGYVKMINNIWEKKPDPTSGWIYYVNGNKVDFGIKDDRARFQSGTVVEFKFYKDAFNEK